MQVPRVILRNVPTCAKKPHLRPPIFFFFGLNALLHQRVSGSVCFATNGRSPIMRRASHLAADTLDESARVA
eukprot:m.427682 g.427682  ORF g.427682 m.427682 type:complete len:72 (-) comp65073_c0_seq1:6-221(-)